MAANRGLRNFEPKALITVALFLLMIGSLLFVIFCCDYVPPYIYSKGFKETTCVVQTGLISGNVCCQASVSAVSGCSSGYIYPCAKVTVQYNVNNQQQNATLFDDYRAADYISLIDQCSYYKCFAQTYENHLRDANTFISTYGTTSMETTCYYNPDNKAVALVKVTSATKLLNVLLWPGLIIVISLIILIIVHVYLKRVPLPLEDDKENAKEEDMEVVRSLTARSDTSSEHSLEEQNKKVVEKSIISRDVSRDSSRPTTRAGIKVDIENNPRAKSAGINRKDSKAHNMAPVM